MSSKLIARGPIQSSPFDKYIELGGGTLTEDVSLAEALIWLDYHAPEQLRSLLVKNPQLVWLQLPFAGVDAFSEILDWIARERPGLIVTSAKGAYSEPVAEHALMMALAIARAVPSRVVAKTWGHKFARSIYDADVLIYGGGGITAELVRLLTPFRAKITVARRNPKPMSGVEKVVPSSELLSILPKFDFVFIAAALTPETKGVFDARAFKAMKSSATLVNIARGGLVVTQDLYSALIEGEIGGAGLDVTDPEPLPDSSPLWRAPNTLITPHTADTPEMIEAMFGERIQSNVKAFLAGERLTGIVDLEAGY